MASVFFKWLQTQKNMQANVVGTLHSIHSSDIIHGDLYPMNIMIDKHHPKSLFIIDFGKSFVMNPYDSNKKQTSDRAHIEYNYLDLQTSIGERLYSTAQGYSPYHAQLIWNKDLFDRDLMITKGAEKLTAVFKETIVKGSQN